MLRQTPRFTLLLYALAVCLFMPAAFASEAGLWEKVAGRLEVHEYLQGDFVQKKQLGFMASPIVSSGHFTMSEAQGLSWMVTKPLRSEMKVHGEMVYLDGQPVADTAIGTFMARIMHGFMAGDLLGMREDFSASGTVGAKSWQLQLVPDSFLLRTVVEHIVLRGDAFLQSIRIVEASETETLIEFSQVSGAELPGPEMHNEVTVDIKGQDAASL